METGGKISFLAFFLMWAELKGWAVPNIHIIACHWLEHRGDYAVLRCFRGFGKSTLLAVYNAWRYYEDPKLRVLHQGDQDRTAYKTSRDTKAVLERHPLTKGMALSGEISFWWVAGSDDERNPSMQASGILSNITSSRADEIQNDDVEVPRNITTPEAREKLRYRLGEQTHILVPGGKILFIGTPHTFDSLYDEKERLGADCLTIKMFDKSFRVENANGRVFPCAFKPDVILLNVSEFTKSLHEGIDYEYVSGELIFRETQVGIIDFYAGLAWPDRFDEKELTKRRKECRTLNEWDSQYQLQAKPVHDCRLNPDLLNVYETEVVFGVANKVQTCRLGSVRIIYIKTRWDVASGQIDRDASVLTILLQDEDGNQYVHRQIRLLGELEEQCEAARKAAIEFKLPHIEVESNGIGKFVPAVLRKALKGTGCSVGDKTEKGNKHARILAGIEPVLSAGKLWAHKSVYDGPLVGQMEDFIPGVDGSDDYPDSLAGAILSSPVRIKKSGNTDVPGQPEPFRPNGKQYTATAKFGV